MAVQQEGQFKGFIAGEALAAFRFVKWHAAGTVKYCDAADSPLGITMEAAALAANVNVRMMEHVGTCKVTASAIIVAGARIYHAADGKVSSTAGGKSLGIALEAASANAAIIEAALIKRTDVHDHSSAVEGERLDATAMADIADLGVGMSGTIRCNAAAAATTAIYTADAPFKFRLIDTKTVRTEGANVGTVKVTDGTNDITNAIDQAAVDQDVDRVGTIDDDYHEIAAGGTLEVVATGVANAPIVYIEILRVA